MVSAGAANVRPGQGDRAEIFPYFPPAEQETEEVVPAGVGALRWWLQVECYLIDIFHWSPHEIDQSDFEHLFEIALRYPTWKKEEAAARKRPKQERPFAENEAYADQFDL